MSLCAWLKEPFNLLKTALSFARYSRTEEQAVKKTYYSNPHFKRCDQQLKRQYRWKNAFSISRRFLEKQGETNVYTYGETPLTSLERIFAKLSLTPRDIVVDLGCGRGRGVFFLYHHLQVPVVGVDWTPLFIEKACKIAQATNTPVTFICSDITQYTCLHEATVVYLAWTCMEEEERLKIENTLLAHTRPGTQVITISYPLQCKNFTCLSSDCISFPWGEAEVFFQKKEDSLFCGM